MKTTQYEQWLAGLRSAIALLDNETITPLGRLKQTLLLTSDAINTIKTEVQKNGFATTGDEIHFFKFVKPAFYALQIYEVDRYNISVNAPVGTAEMRKAYYEQELLYLIRFFRLHAFHYQYFRTGARELDQQYFTRDGRPGDIPVLELADPWPGFSSPLDYLFAKFIAYERLQNELIDQLTGLFSNKIPVSKSTPKLKWTGEAIHLVEVAYGFWLTGQINDGNATITDIIRWLEEHLAIHIGVPSKKWEKISARTHSEPTKYLERMRQAIETRIDEERGIRDRKRKARRTG